MRHDASRAVLAAATLLGLGLGVSAVAATPPAATSNQLKTADQQKQSGQFKTTAVVSAEGAHDAPVSSEGANDTPAPVASNQQKQSTQLKQSDQLKTTAGTVSAEGAHDAPVATTTMTTTTAH